MFSRLTIKLPTYYLLGTQIRILVRVHFPLMISLRLLSWIWVRVLQWRAWISIQSNSFYFLVSSYWFTITVLSNFCYYAVYMISEYCLEFILFSLTTDFNKIKPFSWNNHGRGHGLGTRIAWKACSKKFQGLGTEVMFNAVTGWFKLYFYLRLYYALYSLSPLPPKVCGFLQGPL